MAKQKSNGHVPDVNPDLPELLTAAMVNAGRLITPDPTEADLAELPTLLTFLTPMVVRDPRHKGEGKPKRVLRESLFLLSFDRRNGTFKVSLVDKVCNLSGSVAVGSLTTALRDVEKALISGVFPWSEKKVT